VVCAQGDKCPMPEGPQIRLKRVQVVLGTRSSRPPLAFESWASCLTSLSSFSSATPVGSDADGGGHAKGRSDVFWNPLHFFKKAREVGVAVGGRGT
jgi:hypothetical protein